MMRHSMIRRCKKEFVSPANENSPSQRLSHLEHKEDLMAEHTLLKRTMKAPWTLLRLLVLSLHLPRPHTTHARAPTPAPAPAPSRNAGTNSFNFSISEWDQSSYLTLSGDAALAPDGSRLLLVPGFRRWGTARATFAERVLFLDESSKAEASFSTTFTFSIQVNDSGYMGDGIAFLIASGQEVPEGYEGKNIGLHDAGVRDGDPAIQVLAVEFDTHRNLDLQDPDGHHVGLDVNSLVSLITRDVAALDLALADVAVRKLTAWIDYDARKHQIEVRLARYPAPRRDATRLFTYPRINLAKIVSGASYVGFSAATGMATEENTIYSWSFQSWL